MKIITLILLFGIFFLSVEAKTIKKNLKLANFYRQGPFVFATKLHIGAGYGQADVTYTKGDQIASESLYNDLSMGLVNQTVFNKFLAAPTCQQKMNFLYKIEKFNFKQQTQGMRHLKIYDLQQEQLWYFYLFSCQNKLEQLKGSTQEIVFLFSVLNNGSHFGQNQQTLYGYIAILIIWTLLVIKFAMPMGTLLSLQNPNGLKLSIFGGLIILGAGYLYRLIHLVLYNLDGYGVYAFQILYHVLKNAGEAIITTVIVSISWGWSIIHLNSNQSYIIIGVLAGIFNTVSIILSSITQEHEELFHHYDTVPGGIVLILRIIIFLVFVAGILNCLKESSGKIVHFIRKFALIGGIYLLSWPATVLIVELTLPNYMHKQVITFVEQLIHICACTFICHMISNPESAYRKVSLHEDDNPLGIKEYNKK